MSSFKFSLMSDLHVDHPQPKTPYDLLEKFVVVAGDTANGLEGLKFLNKLKRKGFEVFAVDGNHEHYANRSSGRTQIETEERFFDGIDQTCAETLDDGLMIVGLNGWYPVSSWGQWDNYMNDSRLAQLGAVEVNELAINHAKQIHAMLELHDGPAIVVTHTAPTQQTLNPAYAGHFSNEWYWNPYMREVLAMNRDKILVWCHGHTHAAADEIVDGVRVVCNPRGYPRENPGWKPLTIEVNYG